MLLDRHEFKRAALRGGFLFFRKPHRMGRLRAAASEQFRNANNSIDSGANRLKENFS